MSSWRATIAVVLVFVAGLVCGGAAVHAYRLRAERQIVNSPEPVIQLVIAALDRDLHLSDDQRVAVREIMLESRQEILTAHPELLPELTTMFERTQDRIGTVLTPDQRERYSRLVEERRRVLRQMQDNARPTP